MITVVVPNNLDPLKVDISEGEDYTTGADHSLVITDDEGQEIGRFASWIYVLKSNLVSS